MQFRITPLAQVVTPALSESGVRLLAYYVLRSLAAIGSEECFRPSNSLAARGTSSFDRTVPRPYLVSPPGSNRVGHACPAFNDQPRLDNENLNGY